ASYRADEAERRQYGRVARRAVLRNQLRSHGRESALWLRKSRVPQQADRERVARAAQAARAPGAGRAKTKSLNAARADNMANFKNSQAAESSIAITFPPRPHSRNLPARSSETEEHYALTKKRRSTKLVKPFVYPKEFIAATA